MGAMYRCSSIKADRGAVSPDDARIPSRGWPCCCEGCTAPVFLCVFFPFILDVRLVDVPAGVTQEEGHTGFLIHLPSAVLALIFLARRIQPFLSRVDREVEFCVLTI